MHNFTGETDRASGPHLMLKVPTRTGLKSVLPKAWFREYPTIWLGGGFGAPKETYSNRELMARFEIRQDLRTDVMTDPIVFNNMNVFAVPEERSVAILASFARGEDVHIVLGARPEARFNLDGFREAYGKLVEWCGVNGDDVLFQQVR